jgi:hypothetical protein
MALKKLAKDGVIAKDFPVPCHIVASEDGREVSLIENIHRVAMDAMDEVDAFAALVAEGAATRRRRPPLRRRPVVTSTNASRSRDCRPRSRPPGNAGMSVLKRRARSAWSKATPSKKPCSGALAGP